MNINIYYGGRGLINDPTLYVIDKMQEILEELNVRVTRYNFYECKNEIPTLPQTLKDADGIILATTVEWYGIGGYMQQFLDACWLYGNKEVISEIYMCPIVMSTTYGEKEAQLDLITAWEILGGLLCNGVSGYISDILTLEMNEKYKRIIEKKAEDMYRTINQKVACLPSSNLAVKNKISIAQNVDFTPQETEQLSQYVSDDSYVQRQKEDIQELANLFKNMMGDGEAQEEYLGQMRKVFQAQPGFKANYMIRINDREQDFACKVNGKDLQCYHGTIDDADVKMNMDKSTMDEIMSGRMTFQRAFMSGAMVMKGDFKVLRTLDNLFPFVER